MPKSTFYNLPEEKRQMLIDCAVDEFAENDYESASISKVVATAGIAKGSLYQYFEDKRDLYLYILDQASKKKSAKMAAALQQEPAAGFFTSLERLFDAMLQFEAEEPKLAQIARRILHGKSPLPDEVLQNIRHSTQRFFEEMVIQGKKSGEIHPDVDAKMTAFLLTAALSELGDFVYHTQTRVPTAREIEKEYQGILTILKNGISNPAKE